MAAISAVLVSLLLAGLGLAAVAQSVDEAESEAEEAARRAQAASGLIDEAVADRERIEHQLAEGIARLNDLSAEFSVVAAGLDRLQGQITFATGELTGVEADLEVQAVDAYMSALSAPGVTFVSTENVEQVLVAGLVMGDVIAAGQRKVDELILKKRTLEELRADFLAKQEQVAALRSAVDAELANLGRLYEEADAAVAAAVLAAAEADAAHRQAWDAVEAARAREAERVRQEKRQATTTTTVPTPTTTDSAPPDDEWEPIPQVARWRPMVETHFPAHRVIEALKIMQCESLGDPDAYNPYSGASGLFQFLASTWASSAPRAGYPEASVFDPEPNIATAAWLANRYEELGYYYWQAWSCRRVLD